MREIMDYLILIIICCLSSYIKPVSHQVSVNVQSKVIAELAYSDKVLLLRITNNTSDSVYLYTKAFDEIELSFNGRRMTDADFFYSQEDLPAIPDPLLYDSLKSEEIKNEVGTYINCMETENVDSSLIVYFVNEYKTLNNKDSLNNEEFSFVLSKLNTAMFLTGAILFLGPHDSYTFKFNYSCFKKSPGRYKVKCLEVSVKPRLKYYKTHGLLKNEIIKLPYIPPVKILGYKRYESRIKCKSLRFRISE